MVSALTPASRASWPTYSGEGVFDLTARIIRVGIGSKVKPNPRVARDVPKESVSWARNVKARAGNSAPCRGAGICNRTLAAVHFLFLLAARAAYKFLALTASCRQPQLRVRPRRRFVPFTTQRHSHWHRHSHSARFHLSKWLSSITTSLPY